MNSMRTRTVEIKNSTDDINVWLNEETGRVKKYCSTRNENSSQLSTVWKIFQYNGLTRKQNIKDMRWGRETGALIHKNHICFFDMRVKAKLSTWIKELMGLGRGKKECNGHKRMYSMSNTCFSENVPS